MKAFLYLVIAFLLLNLISCGHHAETSTESKQNIFKVDSEFKPFFNTFIQRSNEQNNYRDIDNLVIEFNYELNSSIYGLCIHEDTPKIQINPAKWENLTYYGREALLFHELGHCILNRIHLNSVSIDGYKASLMHKSLINANNYTEKYEYYVTELFNPQLVDHELGVIR